MAVKMWAEFCIELGIVFKTIPNFRPLRYVVWLTHTPHVCRSTACQYTAHQFITHADRVLCMKDTWRDRPRVKSQVCLG